MAGQIILSISQTKYFRIFFIKLFQNTNKTLFNKFIHKYSFLNIEKIFFQPDCSKDDYKQCPMWRIRKIRPF